MARQNVAYDLSLFEPAKKPKREQTQMRVIKTKTKKRAQISPMVKLTAISLIIATVLSIILTQVALTEVTMQISEANEQYNDAVSEKVRLDSEMSALISVKNVEKVATQELGLSKIDESQIEYISLNVENQGQVNKQNRNLLEKIKMSFDNLQSYIAGIFNNN